MRVARARWWWTTLPKRHARMMTTTRLMKGSMVSWRISLNLCSSVKRHARDLTSDRCFRIHTRGCRHRLASESMDDARQGESGIGTLEHPRMKKGDYCSLVFPFSTIG
jgi:hypothetical protein